jgi:hypothetical protein
MTEDARPSVVVANLTQYFGQFQTQSVALIAGRMSLFATGPKIARHSRANVARCPTMPIAVVMRRVRSPGRAQRGAVGPVPATTILRSSPRLSGRGLRAGTCHRPTRLLGSSRSAHSTRRRRLGPTMGRSTSNLTCRCSAQCGITGRGPRVGAVSTASQTARALPVRIPEPASHKLHGKVARSRYLDGSSLHCSPQQARPNIRSGERGPISPAEPTHTERHTARCSWPAFGRAPECSPPAAPNVQRGWRGGHRTAGVHPFIRPVSPLADPLHSSRTRAGGTASMPPPVCRSDRMLPGPVASVGSV